MSDTACPLCAALLPQPQDLWATLCGLVHATFYLRCGACQHYACRHAAPHPHAYPTGQCAGFEAQKETP